MIHLHASVVSFQWVQWIVSNCRYMCCLHEKNQQNTECRELAKQYFSCRMEKVRDTVVKLDEGEG